MRRIELQRVPGVRFGLKAQIFPVNTQNICITFVQRRPNVFDVGPTLYNCFTNVFSCVYWGYSLDKKVNVQQPITTI